MQLDRQTILAAALKILQEYGLGDLSMRRLAKALNVAPGALYWHFPSKQALLGGIVDDHILAEIPQTETAEKLAVSVFNALTSIRDGAEITVAAIAAGTIKRNLRKDFIATCGNRGETVYHYVLGAAIETQAQQSWQIAQGKNENFDQPDIAAGATAIMR